jgi:predicted AAA+ superfamily ATPase
VVEQSIALESLARPGTRFHFLRTQTGTEVDLIVDRGATRLGVEIKCAATVDNADTRGLRLALREGVITQAVIVYQGERAFPLADGIQACPASTWLLDTRNWPPE